jgi:hypothetical protein
LSNFETLGLTTTLFGGSTGSKQMSFAMDNSIHEYRPKDNDHGDMEAETATHGALSKQEGKQITTSIFKWLSSLIF